MAMQEDLNQFERNNVWELVPNPEHQSIIGTKWVFRNKMDESGVVVRNKARLVAQGYNQEEACKLGVYIHGLAGDIAAEEMTEIGMTAHDIINALPTAWKKMSSTSSKI